MIDSEKWETAKQVEEKQKDAIVVAIVFKWLSVSHLVLLVHINIFFWRNFAVLLWTTEKAADKLDFCANILQLVINEIL